jgi:hypothetical protein
MEWILAGIAMSLFGLTSAIEGKRYHKRAEELRQMWVNAEDTHVEKTAQGEFISFYIKAESSRACATILYAAGVAAFIIGSDAAVAWLH